MSANKATPEAEGTQNFGNDTMSSKTTEKLRNIKDTVRDVASEAKPTLENMYSDTKARISDMAYNVKNRAQDVTRNLDDQVHRNPWPFIGGVAVTSLLLGFVLGRRD